MSRMTLPVRPALALLLAGSLALSCGGDPDSSADPSDPPSSTVASPEITAPEGVELTEGGSELKLGDNAIVAWKPRSDVTGVLDITVSKIEQTTVQDFIAFKLDEASKASTPYYVRASVTNAGETDLSGVPVPLYVVDQETNKLVQASNFASTFKPCPSVPLPKEFAAGKTTNVCLVFLIPDHGKLESVSFRPGQEYNPIVWTGSIGKAKPYRPKPPKPSGSTTPSGSASPSGSPTG